MHEESLTAHLRVRKKGQLKVDAYIAPAVKIAQMVDRLSQSLDSKKFKKHMRPWKALNSMHI